MREGLLRALATITRRIHPRGTERVLRLLHDPDAFGKPGAPRAIEAVLRLPNGYRLQISTDSFLEWLVFFKGDYEPEMTRLLASLLQPGETVIDVGANIGIHTLSMSRAVGRGGLVVSCEPHPVVRGRLLDNLRLNDIQNVRVEPVAVSDRAGTIEFYIADPNAANQAVSSLYADADPTLLTAPLLVDAKTLDQIAEGLPTPVKLIKIDVEGAEPMVLRGGESLLRRDRPKVIFEFCRSKWEPAGFELDAVVMQLRQWGYSSFQLIERRGLVPLGSGRIDMTNVLATA